ncbi:MAG: PQQ-binding-like beta-propeller repeat protein, partial [Alphaproteobacteria bacterium]|nr:PQQ-binding-like beta-propeller repeat protein [Alphaproteobacteria bacterium]
LWTLETPRALDIAPIIADGVLYVAGSDCGSICAYGLP